MTAKLTLGSGLSVDAVEYASRANAILGIRDSGKTYTGTLIAEQLYNAGIPFFAFDPIGRWRFLKVNGAGKGLQVVVAGGTDPDLPLSPENAPKLIRAAMATGISMVIDLYSIGLSKRDWRDIVRSSIEAILYEGEGHGLRHVFLEEAAEFIPQRVRDGQTYAAVEKLARMGGNVGVGVTLINQRAEEVNKAVLELCDNLLLHRQRGKNSLLSLRKWLEAGNVNPPKEITDTLADLPTGQCWAWFKDVGKPKLIKVQQKRSFDPNRRTMSQKTAKIPAGSADVSKFVAAMKTALAGKPKPQIVLPVAQKKIADRFYRQKLSELKEVQVDEKEARALRAENEALKRKIAELTKGEHRYAPNEPSKIVGPVTNESSNDVLYAEIKRRLLADPAIIQLLAVQNEIEVTIERKIIQLDDSKLVGRVAQMIAEGFFDQSTTASAAFTDLQRRGKGSAKPNVYKACDELTTMGFLTKESDGYRAVEGMKIRIVEAA